MNVEEMLKLAVAKGAIKAYAINGNRYEINTGHSIVSCDSRGALEELKSIDPGLFDESVIPAEVPVAKPKRKSSPKKSR